jgi:DNA-binding MarR family transcriptional regulator
MVNVMQTTTVKAPVEVANRLRPVLLQLVRELRREVHPLGVTGGQVSLLVQIKRHPSIGVRELAALERVSPAAMSGAIDRLERAGLVARQVHAADRRRQGLTISVAGERVLRAVKRRRTAWLATRLERLAPAELEAVDAAVEPLLGLLEDTA